MHEWVQNKHPELDLWRLFLKKFLSWPKRFDGTNLHKRTQCAEPVETTELTELISTLILFFFFFFFLSHLSCPFHMNEPNRFVYKRDQKSDHFDKLEPLSRDEW